MDILERVNEKQGEHVEKAEGDRLDDDLRALWAWPSLQGKTATTTTTGSAADDGFWGTEDGSRNGEVGEILPPEYRKSVSAGSSGVGGSQL